MLGIGINIRTMKRKRIIQALEAASDETSDGIQVIVYDAGDPVPDPEGNNVIYVKVIDLPERKPEPERPAPAPVPMDQAPQEPETVQRPAQARPLTTAQMIIMQAQARRRRNTL